MTNWRIRNEALDGGSPLGHDNASRVWSPSPHCPEENSLIERMDRTLHQELDGEARTNLLDAENSLRSSIDELPKTNHFYHAFTLQIDEVGRFTSTAMVDFLPRI